MPKKFKCPICGCEKHYLLKPVDSEGVPLFTFQNTISGDIWGGILLEGNFEPYLCSECGHIQLFSPEILKEINRFNEEVNEEVKELSESVKELKAEISAIKGQITLNDSRVKELAKLLENDEITVKQQREYQEELKQIPPSSFLRSKLESLENELSKKESALQEAKNSKVK